MSIQPGHIVLALILLTDSIGITITRHYCHDELKSVSFYSNKTSCEPDLCEDSNVCAFEENSCCSREIAFFKWQVDLGASLIKAKTVKFTQSAVITVLPTMNLISARLARFHSYLLTAPPRVVDILTWVQSLRF